jgi:hypothetical protein
MTAMISAMVRFKALSPSAVDLGNPNYSDWPITSSCGVVEIPPTAVGGFVHI